MFIRKEALENTVRTFEGVMRKHSIPLPQHSIPLPPLGEGHRDLPLLPRGEGYLTTGDPRFHALLKQIGELHDKKQRDYGRDADAFANVRASEEFGVEAWIGCMIRAQDKLKRLQTYAQKGTLACEGVEDSFMDLAVYSLIGLILYRESIAPRTQSPDR